MQATKKMEERTNVVEMLCLAGLLRAHDRLMILSCLRASFDHLFYIHVFNAYAWKVFSEGCC